MNCLAQARELFIDAGSELAVLSQLSEGGEIKGTRRGGGAGGDEQADEARDIAFQRIAAAQETITVTAATPVVDVTQAGQMPALTAETFSGHINARVPASASGRSVVSWWLLRCAESGRHSI